MATVRIFRPLILIGIFSLMISGNGISQTIREKLLNLASQNTSDGKVILQRAGDFEFEKFVAKKDSVSMLEDFGTVIHESCHQLNHLIANTGYFITKGIDIVAEQGPVFNSTELNKMVPKKLQTDIYRYGTYIGTPQEYLGSQVDGIYGMVDELCAYYHGTKASYELYDFYYKYRCNGYKNAGEWASYVQHVASSYFAWYEFRLFIAWYLEYAEKNHPEVYESSMNNTRLRLAYTLIDNQYGPLVRDFNARLEDLAKKLTAGNVTVELADYEGERSFIVRTRQTASRTSTEVYSIFSNRIRQLEELLKGDQNAMLEKFRIKDANTENYKSFLK